MVISQFKRLFKRQTNVGLEPEEVAIITGIGCSGRLSGYINSYGVHGIHGRALPLAQGVKMANKDLTVIASGGDGDGYAIGMGHTIHALRRNMNMTYIVMDNQIYGLTKGQTSPSSRLVLLLNLPLKVISRRMLHHSN